MSNFECRPFSDDAEIIDLCHAFMACSLPKEKWTHEAHLALCLWLVRERGDIDPETYLPIAIRKYNIASGGVNDDTQGYHETLTQIYIRSVRFFLQDIDDELTLVDAVNLLLQSPRGHRSWPLGHYSKEHLFSVEARRNFVEPDLVPIV
jgi:hypothetical protein